MKTLHIVSGGIGKTIIFTSLLKKLKEKYNKNISLHTMYNEIFDNHYAVDKIIPTFEYFLLIYHGNKFTGIVVINNRKFE